MESIIISIYFSLIKNAAMACLIKWAEVEKVECVKDPKDAKSMMSLTSATTMDNYRSKTRNTVVDGLKADKTKKPRELYKCRRNFVKLNHFSLLGVGLGDNVISSVLSRLVMLSHENIIVFIGIVLDSPEKCVLTETAPKGTLYDLLDGSDMELTQDFKISLLLDVANGMKYIHQTALGYHGKLSSKCCFLDSKFTCKVSDYWIRPLSVPNVSTDNDLSDIEDKLWMAPEVLQQTASNDKCDVYSFGIITQEVLLTDRPYAANMPPLAHREIVRLVAEGDKHYRPALPTISSEWKDFCQQCWAGGASKRPTFAKILQMLIELNGGQKMNVVESMLKRMEAHTRHLEEIVEQRSVELIEEKMRAETLICELLPRSVFEQMSLGNTVEPETFDEVTMFFSDIEGFTKIASLAGPMDIVSLLNRLYMIFDAVLVKYDVYKLATIGDAYIVVSGLPVRNGNRHAGEIAAMSLELINSITDFEISHMPGKFLRMRVGLHTGSCVGAVTGIKMPRYLLFGDMVNTGTRIEALGEAMRIHVSDTTSRLLKRDKRFTLFPRSQKLDIPGHGIMHTSWLEP